MVTLANCVFISKVETSNPPIRILRIKGGNFLRKKDGGYYLAGKPADWEVNEDWDMLLDGRELKGESITFLGEFATLQPTRKTVIHTVTQLTAPPTSIRTEDGSS